MTFSPSITDYSRKLADKKRLNDSLRSPLSQRGRSESPSFSPRQASPSPRRQPVDLTSSVQRDLEKTKQKMQMIQEKKQKQQNNKYKPETNPNANFKPTLLASNKNNKILVNSPLNNFETRNLMAVETLLLRKVISSRTPSPGPGHYYNNTDININAITDSLSYSKSLRPKQEDSEENYEEGGENNEEEEEAYSESADDNSTVQKSQKQVIQETINGIDASLQSLSRLSPPPRRLSAASGSSVPSVPNPGHLGYSFGKSKHTTTLTSKQLIQSQQFVFSKTFES